VGTGYLPIGFRHPKHPQDYLFGYSCAVRHCLLVRLSVGPVIRRPNPFMPVGMNLTCAEM